MIRKVPKEFVLGAAMSAYQMEGAAAAGGREPSVWEDWLRRTVPAARRHTSDFYHHYEEDIAASAAKRIRSLSLVFLEPYHAAGWHGESRGPGVL